MTSDGSIQVGAWGHAAGTVTTQVLAPRFERDDHDAPAFLVLPDGRLAVFYALHARGDMRLRTTVRPSDISAWSPERTLGFEQPSRGSMGTIPKPPGGRQSEAHGLPGVTRARVTAERTVQP